MKRRIEITRERWTRVRVQPGGSPRCAGCGSTPELRTVSEAAQAVAVAVEQIERALHRGELATWNASNGLLVCLQCVQNLVAGR